MSCVDITNNISHKTYINDKWHTSCFSLTYKVTRSKWLFLYKPERIFYSVFINSVFFYSEDFKKNNLILFVV